MSLEFADNVIDVAENLGSGRRHYRLVEQVEAAVASIAQNIAEGKGRYSKKEFVQYLYIARGSLYETVTLLSLFRQREWVSGEDCGRLLEKANRIAGMINRLIDSLRVNIANNVNNRMRAGHGEPVAASGER